MDIGAWKGVESRIFDLDLDQRDKTGEAECDHFDWDDLRF